MKREINPFDYAGDIFKALPRGILLTSEAEDCVNAMTIGWGTLGIEWGVPIFTAYVRTSLLTANFLRKGQRQSGFAAVSRGATLTSWLKPAFIQSTRRLFVRPRLRSCR